MNEVMNADGGLMWLWWLIGAFVLVAVIWEVVGNSRRRRPGDSNIPGNADLTADERLKRQFEKGEIDQQVYERRMRKLQHQDTAA